MALCFYKCGCEVGEARDCGMCCEAAVERREAAHARPLVAEALKSLSTELIAAGAAEVVSALASADEPEPPAPAPTSRRGKRRG